MAVPISNVTRRVVYAASGTGPYNFTFEILANTDIAVYRDDSLLTLTTDYTVTINTNGTGYVTLAATPTGATQIAIVGNRTIQRTTDFVTGGDFFANTVNNEMDQQTIFAQQNAEAIQRALIAPQTDPTNINMTLPRAALRAGKTLAFDSNGNPSLGDTLGTNRGNWASGVLYYVRDIVKDTSNNNIWQCITQHTSSGSQPINTNTDSAKWSLLVDTSSATTASTNAAASASAAATSASNASSSASAASTSASNAASSASSAASSASSASSAQTAAEAARDQTLAVYDSFDDRYLGSKTSDPSVDNDGNALVAGALYFNSVSGIMKLYTGTAWVAAYVQGVAASINFTPAGGVAASNVQAAIEEVDSEKLAKAGDTMTGPLLLPAGSASAPALSRSGDTDTGIFFPAADTIAFAEGGVEVARINSDGQIVTIAGTASLPALTFTGDLNTGIYSSGADALNFAEGGVGFRVGYRNIPPVGTKTSSYTLATSDVGKYVQVGTSGSITIPTSTFSEGDAISLVNNTTGNITITCSAPTAYIAGTNTVKTSMTLATRGVATVFFISSTVCVVTGNVT
jgi:hypothetical protein